MDKRAVFMDKDGTLIENVPYNVDFQKIRLTDGAVTALRRIKKAGYLLFIVTNQSGVALGHYSEEEVRKVGDFLKKILKREKIELDGFYYCPHHPDGIVHAYTVPCFCRKPNPGLIFQAARDHDVNLAESWMIGDILNDIEAGNRANCRTILMDVRNETEWDLQPLRRPHYTVKNLPDAADIVLAMGEPKQVTKMSNPLPVKIQKLTPQGHLIETIRTNGNGNGKHNGYPRNTGRKERKAQVRTASSGVHTPRASR